MADTLDQQRTIDALLRDQIRALETNLNKRLDATERSVSDRFDQQDKALGRIEEQVSKTNGRVTVLEKARERAQGVMFAYRWVPTVLAALVTGGLTILGLALTGQIH